MCPVPAVTEIRRWMIVDDDTNTLRLMKAVARRFTSAAIECHEAPESALAAYADAPTDYELVLTDFEMPGMNGAELCRRLRSISSRQPVILVTGSQLFSPATAQEEGFDALLPKPFPLVAFRKALAETGVLPKLAVAN